MALGEEHPGSAGRPLQLCTLARQELPTNLTSPMATQTLRSREDTMALGEEHLGVGRDPFEQRTLAWQGPQNNLTLPIQYRHQGKGGGITLVKASELT